ncbi:hypothetical protein EBZ39_13210, partial [bacterium]|nr:hypothetical protein [bacterium]
RAQSGRLSVLTDHAPAGRRVAANQIERHVWSSWVITGRGMLFSSTGEGRRIAWNPRLPPGAWHPATMR